MGAVLTLIGDPVSVYRISGSKAWAQTSGKVQFVILSTVAVLGSIVSQTLMKPESTKVLCRADSDWDHHGSKPLSIGCFNIVDVSSGEYPVGAPGGIARAPDDDWEVSTLTSHSASGNSSSLTYASDPVWVYDVTS